MSAVVSALLVGLLAGPLAPEAWAGATLYAPTVSDQPALAVAAGPAFIARGDEWLPGGRLSLAAEPAEAWTANATVGVYAAQSPELFATANLAWRALDRPKIRLGPSLAAAEHLGPSPLDHRLTGRLGLALETRGRTRFDLSLPLVGAQFFPAPTVETRLSLLSPVDNLFGAELGLSRELGQRHTARVGLMGPMPMLSWRADWGPCWTRLWAGSFGMASHLGLEIGWSKGGQS